MGMYNGGNTAQVDWAEGGEGFEHTADNKVAASGDLGEVVRPSAQTLSKTQEESAC